ncbi:MAG: archaeosortase/exosortase family protein, partial [Gammaproteobacteria bacterium]
MRQFRDFAAVILIATILFVYRESVFSLWSKWSTAETYAHGFLIPPLTMYLLYQMRGELATIERRTCWWALPVLAACGAVWLVGELTDLQVLHQLALIGIVLSVILLLLGWTFFNAALFPLCFLLLAVPLGDGLTPHLIEMTADFVVR